MKKIIFLVLTLFALVNNVKANVWQEDKIEGENVITETRYRFFKEIETGEYLRKGMVTDYQYEDENNIIYTEYSDYQNTCPTGEGYEVEHAIKYEYQERLKVKYLKINNISQKNLSIKNLEFKVDDKIINYSYHSCTKCNSDLTTINSIGVLIIELEESVNFENLTINLEFNNVTSKSYYELQYSDDISFSVEHMIAIVTANTIDTVYKYKVNNFYLYPNYGEVYTEYDIEVNELMQNVVKENVCKVREVKTYHYNKNKEYYDDNYYTDVKELINLSFEEQKLYQKDLNDYKIYYLNTTNDKNDNTTTEDNKKDNEITYNKDDNNITDDTDNIKDDEITNNDEKTSKEEIKEDNLVNKDELIENDNKINDSENVNNSTQDNNKTDIDISDINVSNKENNDYKEKEDIIGNNILNSSTKEEIKEDFIKESEKHEDNNINDKTLSDKEENTKFNENNLKLVKTGIDSKQTDYKFLIIYVLTLVLIALIMLKYLKRMSK